VPIRQRQQAQHASTGTAHLISETPRVMVVDGSKMVRKMIADVLVRELPAWR
jgi:hypothetical protein